MDALLRQIWAEKVTFLLTFFVVFTISYIALLAIDFVPEAPAATSEEALGARYLDEPEESLAVVPAAVAESEVSPVTEQPTVVEAPTAVSNENEPVLPTKIMINKLEKEISVLNPASRLIADLDAALLEGVVRHPDSATLNQEGNVFILGHSSYLPNIFNKNFQAFNGIQDLEWGDVIQVFSETAVYDYRVERVYRANAQEVTVPIAGTGKMLTLATCNSFGSVDDRYIVEAKQVRVRML